ncbi:MAG: DUF393 domain-containing protein [Pseudarcicella sp.]|jgi:predicted DCC family thiol-disulfide oxidoreductase YuxK|nr:DUF393 domain-containing protein [Pseudarcicella sp.]MBP6409529.1 DUF393 domain-containing protein [Pseudarcicella sp.]
MNSDSKTTFSIIFFDGECGFCNRAVNFVLKKDSKQAFRYASLQSETAQRYLKPFEKELINIDSIVLYRDGKVFVKSQAVLLITKELPFPWKFAYCLKIIPTLISNWFYDIFAKNRRRLFAKNSQCALPSPAQKVLFLK